ncbi:MAG: (d)CMP kinase [Phycisphaerales bacterium]|nr:(d)CMP kinase [Phycisphaerales bacterium]
MQLMMTLTAAASIIVTIDGPAGTGKSTVASSLARRLGLEFLDTGAMYRAIAWRALTSNIDPRDTVAVTELALASTLRFDWKVDPPELFIDGVACGDAIRTPAVTAAVAIVACNADVRRAMVRQQRAIAAAHPRLVTEGRDQGSAVFPDATVRIYLDAAPEIRAQRRSEQLSAKGVHVDAAEILQSIVSRDASDRARSEGPLVRPEGADVVDTGGLDVERVVDALEVIVRRHARAIHELPTLGTRSTDEDETP